MQTYIAVLGGKNLVEIAHRARREIVNNGLYNVTFAYYSTDNEDEPIWSKGVERYQWDAANGTVDLVNIVDLTETVKAIAIPRKAFMPVRERFILRPDNYNNVVFDGEENEIRFKMSVEDGDSEYLVITFSRT